MSKNVLTLTRAEIEDMPSYHSPLSMFDSPIEALARRRAQQVDDIVLSLLKPWQRKLLLSRYASRWYMKPFVKLAKYTAGITIEHHQGAVTTADNRFDLRMESRVVIKQHGKIIKAEN